MQVESAIYKRLRSLRPRELAACAWAFSTMRYTPNVEWLDAFAQQCMSLVSEFSMQVCNCWGWGWEEGALKWKGKGCLPPHLLAPDTVQDWVVIV